jgi:uncharacterized protein YcbX
LIPIKELSIYPCRGIPGIRVESVELGEHGLRYDRIFIIYVDGEKRHRVTSSNSPDISTLSQEFKTLGTKKYLVIKSKYPERLMEKDLPEELLIDMDHIPKGKIEVGDNLYSGYKMESHVNQWITAALKRNSIMLRS